MTQEQRRCLVAAMEPLETYVRTQPGFMGDEDLKAAYVILATVKAAFMFGEAQPLAKLCADFCGDKSRDVIESN